MQRNLRSTGRLHHTGQRQVGPPRQSSQSGCSLMADHAAESQPCCGENSCPISQSQSQSLSRSLFLSLSVPLSFSLSLPPPPSLSLFLSLLIAHVTLIEQLWSNHTRDGAKVASGHTQTLWPAALIISVDNIYRAEASSAAAPRCLCPALLSGQRYVWHNGATPKISPGACE